MPTLKLARAPVSGGQPAAKPVHPLNVSQTFALFSFNGTMASLAALATRNFTAFLAGILIAFAGSRIASHARLAVNADQPPDSRHHEYTILLHLSDGRLSECGQQALRDLLRDLTFVCQLKQRKWSDEHEYRILVIQTDDDNRFELCSANTLFGLELKDLQKRGESRYVTLQAPARLTRNMLTGDLQLIDSLL
jgi:hypothetical protein